MEIRNDPAHDLSSPHFQMFPSVEDVSKIIAMSSDDGMNVRKIAQAIEERPMIAAAMMRAVNAVSVGAPRQIHSLRHALTMMGMRHVRAILREIQEEAIEQRQRHFAQRGGSPLTSGFRAGANGPLR